MIRILCLLLLLGHSATAYTLSQEEVQRSYRLLEEGRLAEARSVAKSAISSAETAEDRRAARAVLATVAEERGDSEEAIETLEAMVAEGPFDAARVRNSVVSLIGLYAQTNQWARAEQLVQTQATFDKTPDNRFTLYQQLGQVQVLHGRLREAEASLRLALKYGEEDGSSMENLLDILLNIARFTQDQKKANEICADWTPRASELGFSREFIDRCETVLSGGEIGPFRPRRDEPNPSPD